MCCVLLMMIVMAAFSSPIATSFEPLLSSPSSSLTTWRSKIGPTPTTESLVESDKMSSMTLRDAPNTTTASSLKTTTAHDGYHAGLSPHLNSSQKTAVKDDFIVIEMVRLVFIGNMATAGFPNKVYGLLESFLTRATREVRTTDGSEWSFDLSSTLRPIEFQNTTYMDFRITHTARKEISAIFNQLELQNFISQNSPLELAAVCWTNRNCQNGTMEGSFGISILEKNVSIVTTVAVLCSLCLVVMVTGMTCSCLRKLKTSKTANDKTKARPTSGEFQRVTVNASSSVSVQASKEGTTEETFFKSCPFVDEDDEDDDLHSTWVIPLDKAPGRQGTVIVVTTQDTKL